MEEIWRDVPKYEGLYQVSNLGNVKSFKWNKERLLKKRLMKTGYFSVVLMKDNKRKEIYIHQLVAISFLNHKPNGTNHLVVDHINNIKTDNKIENIQLISNRENCSKDRKCKTSKYRGVSWNKKAKKWVSQIIVHRKVKNLGFYNCEYSAHLAYQKELVML